MRDIQYRADNSYGQNQSLNSIHIFSSVYDRIVALWCEIMQAAFGNQNEVAEVESSN